MHPGLNAIISAVKVASGEYTLEEVLLDAAVGYLGGKIFTQAIGAFHQYRAIKKSAKALRGVSEIYEHVGKRGSYREMAKLTRGFNHEIEAHHLVEVRHANRWGGINADDVPAVILPRQEHAMITKALIEKLPRQMNHTKQEVWAVYREVYGHRPEWLSAIERYFH
jgi:hypothetical protein